MAVKLGYTKVYRDPLGFPAWEQQGLPITRAPMGLCEPPGSAAPAGLPSGLALVWTLLGIFAGGLALNLTPCVYPLIPITASYFGGRSGQGRGRLVAHGLLYLMGLAVTNSVLGVAAALTGGLMGGLLQSPWVLGGVAAILMLFAASLLGLWELRLPGKLTQAAGRSYAGYGGSLFMGLTLGVVAAPCIGPFVLGLLTWVASIGSPRFGFLIFFTLSLGLGLPLFVLAMFSGSLNKLPRSGEWLLWVRKLMGWVLAGMAVYFLRPLIAEAWWVALLAGVMLLAALHLGALDRTPAYLRVFPWLKSIVWLAGIFTVTFLVGSWALQGPGVAWQPYSEAILDTARAQKKPVIIDFYATWCAPCRELEEITFHHSEVVKLAQDFVMVKVDLTKKGDPSHQQALGRYAVKGVPTVVFLDQDGKECQNLRLVDYLPPEQFLSRLAAFRTTGLSQPKGD